MTLDAKTALLLVDMQQAIDDPEWAREGPRNNLSAEARALALLDAWRAAGMPVIHVRHDSVEPASTFRPGTRGHRFKQGFGPLPSEDVVPKHTPSAFANTPLEAFLRERGITQLVLVGVITNNSVEATVRHGGTLGFDIILAEDACFTFARSDWNGVVRSAEEVHAMSLANLHSEYCRVSTVAAILAAHQAFVSEKTDDGDTMLDPR